jgi:hypothetical protein
LIVQPPCEPHQISQEEQIHRVSDPLPLFPGIFLKWKQYVKKKKHRYPKNRCSVFQIGKKSKGRARSTGYWLTGREARENLLCSSADCKHVALVEESGLASDKFSAK